MDGAGWGADRLDGCGDDLIDLLAEHNLVDRFRLDHPEQVGWTWLGNSPSGQIRTYLDGVLVGGADIEFIFYPMF